MTTIPAKTTGRALPDSRGARRLRSWCAVCSAAAFGSLGSVTFLDLLSRRRGSEFVYVTAASRVAIGALVPLVLAILVSLVAARGSRRRAEPVDMNVLVSLDLALIAAAASTATRDHSDFLRTEPTGWLPLILGVAAVVATAFGLVPTSGSAAARQPEAGANSDRQHD